MKKIIVTVFDVKSQLYYGLQLVRTNAEAIRNFSLECKNQESMFNKFPEDYSLVSIGEYDDEEGQLIPYPKNTILCNATEFVTKGE